MDSPPDRSGGLRDEDLRVWMAQYGPGLRRYFQKRAGAAEAEDLVQDVFLRLQGRAEGGVVDNVERYLFRTAANVMVSRHRAQLARGWTTRHPFDETLQPPDELSPERVLIAKQEISRVILAMERLPPRARAAFVFHRFEEMTYPAIATRMGISVKAVEQLINRALERLAQEVKVR